MKTINHNQLESTQAYSKRRYMNDPDDPYEREPDTFICGLCCEEVVENENTYCPCCKMAQAEYREDR